MVVVKCCPSLPLGLGITQRLIVANLKAGFHSLHLVHGWGYMPVYILEDGALK